MTDRSSQLDWVIFLLLGFIWGSSYLFIKLAVDDFGTFTLVALRLIVGGTCSGSSSASPARSCRATGRIYGHLIVMAIINITIPFLLITWAEQSVESSLAAILTSPVPLFTIVLSALFLPDEPMRVNGLIGLIVGFIGVVIITSRGLTGAGSSLIGEIALLGRGPQLCRRGCLLAAQCPGRPADDPGGLPGHLRRDHRGRPGHHPRATVGGPPDAQAVFSILWLGILGSGIAYLFVFRLFAHWGATRTTLVAYLLPVVGIVLGYIVLAEPVDARLIVGTGLVIAGVALVNSRFGRRRLFGRGAPAADLGRPSLELGVAPSARTARHRRSASTHRPAGRCRRGPPPRPAGPSPRRRRIPRQTRATAPRPTSGAMLSAHRINRYAARVSQPPMAAYRICSRPAGEDAGRPLPPSPRARARCPS